ncbi:Nucleoplasmin-like domain containing protein, putative [Angomonas deanei]|uniref:Nucleoplasmin-like domain containing protein, putative n=1 Tax=Angomonas deanei TaxID=59799 RepID=A0A7G2CST5_9TRYP|nr:Nucleoplasmin-like domain containing protein, putative [Angomonas deanei]
MQQFHAFEVLPGKTHKLTIPDGFGFHLSVISLPQKSNGQTTLYVFVGGKSYALATVDSARNILQVSTDLIFNSEQDVSFSAKGSSAVHCVGYIQDLDDDDEGFPLGDEEDLSEDGEEQNANTRLPIEDDGSEEESSEGGEEQDPTQVPEGSDDEESGDEETGDEESRSDDVVPVDDSDDEELEIDSDDADADAIEGSEDEEIDSDDLDEDDEESDDEEDAQPVRKSARMEGQSSPAKNAGGQSPQARGSQGHGRPSGGSPQGRSPQARQSGGSPNGRQGGASPQGRKSGSFNQGRRSH